MGHRHHHDAGRRAGHLHPARLPVPAHRAALDRHRRLLPGGVGRDGRKQRGPDHRAEDDRVRQAAVHVGHERRLRRRPHRAHLRARDRPGPRLGPGAEQAPARDGEPAGGGPDAGGQGQQVDAELAHHRGAGLGRRQHGRLRPGGLRPVQHPAGAGPRAGRGRGRGLFLPVFDAGLAEPGPAGRLPHDGGGRRPPIESLQRRDLRRAVRRRAGRRRPAAERLDHRPEPAQDPRGVRRDPAADQPRRVDRPRARRRSDRARHRALREPDADQRQAVGRARRAPGPGRQCARHRRRHQGEDGGALEILPARDEGHLPQRHDPVREGGDQGSRQDPVRSGPAGVPGDVPLPREHPGDADPDAGRAGRHPGDLRGPGAVRVLDQHADHVRDGARDRPAGGRRHRRGRERRARHVRGGALAPGGHGASPWTRSRAP